MEYDRSIIDLLQFVKIFVNKSKATATHNERKTLQIRRKLAMTQLS